MPNQLLDDPCYVFLCTDDVHVPTLLGVCQECPGSVVGEMPGMSLGEVDPVWERCKMSGRGGRCQGDVDPVLERCKISRRGGSCLGEV